MEKKRLSKTMAAAGVASRRACETLIFDGQVSVNGKTVLEPQTLVSLDEDEVLVNGESLSHEEKKVYYVLNKPSGFVCSNRPSKNSGRVVDLFSDIDARLFTVGRLDADTTGLLLVTNDGHFANRVIHPSSNVQKEYLAQTDGTITPHHLRLLSQGCRIQGVFVKPLKVSVMRRNTIKITIKEGKKHEVRILFANTGLKVRSLTRTRIGNLRIGQLRLGAYRRLSPSQIESIFG